MKQYPFDDEIMTYDLNDHRYVLTEKGVQTELGINLQNILNLSFYSSPTIAVNRFLRKISQSVYFYLYRDSMNPEWLEYILATYPPLREWVREMLQAQLLYVLENNFVADYSGVNIAKGHTIEVNWLRDRVTVAIEVEQIAGRFIPGLGYALNYCGQLPDVPCQVYHKEY